jgi:ATP-dependent exoDNAse (exonuclease V) alpha subunit
MSTLNKVLKLLEESNVFLTGGAGVGKSYLTREIINDYKSDYRGIVILGSTGISAVNIGGQTIHSFFVFGISSNFDELSSSDRYARSRLKELDKILQKTDLIVIDEISMVSADLMDMILYRLRATRYKGKLLVVGDFYQLPPIIKRQSSNTMFADNVYAFEGSSWEYFNFEIAKLNKVKRTSDKEFMGVLEKIRVGEMDSDSIKYLTDLRANQLTDDTNQPMLYGRNYEADVLNRQKIALSPREEFELPSVIDVKDSKLKDNRIKSWINNLPIIENLILKEGIPIIFTTNKWGTYHNGEKAIVEHIDTDHVVVDKGGKLVKVERFEFELNRSVVDNKGDLDSEVLCSLKQFPIRPAYAITIHKSQGMSLDNLICNVDHIFADSQFYVALSRAVDPKSLQIIYSRNDFESYLKRVISVSESVKNFYANCEMVKLD